MDITRNWRLKTTRSQLLATRDPQTGAVVLPHGTVQHAAEPTYTFDAAVSQPAEAGFAEAAR